MKTVIYFTAGPTPTSPEQVEITAAQALVGYTVLIRAASLAEYSDGVATPADYVMGSPPAAYSGYTVLVPGDVPTPALLEEGDTIVLTDAAGVTLNCVLVVTNGVPTLTCPSTAAILKSGVAKASAAVSGSRTTGYTPTIVAGAITVLVGS